MATLIAAIDDSPTAVAVLDVATALAGVFAIDVTALHLDHHRERAAAIAAAAGVDIAIQPVPASGGIIAAVESPDVVGLVIGTRSTPAGRQPAGSVAVEVITAVAKPVVVVPPETRQPFELRRVLVPLDGSRETTRALAQTMRLANGRGIEVVVLHVLDTSNLPLFSDQPQHEVRDWSAEFIARHCGPGSGARLVARTGNPVDHVLEVAVLEQADMVALGWSQVLTGSRAQVVRDALARSGVPVLLTPV